MHRIIRVREKEIRRHLMETEMEITAMEITEITAIRELMAIRETVTMEHTVILLLTEITDYMA